MLSVRTSTMTLTPPCMVIASGCERPIPPRPALKRIRPRKSPLKCRSAIMLNVSKVPSTTPWLPMYCQGPAVYDANAVRLRSAKS